MEGRPIESQSLFLALPSEILGEIMVLIADEKATLSAFALVNSDCRQLARSCQFVDVCFDYGSLTGKLLERLLVEAQTRENATGNAASPLFIGSCIRRVKVNPKPDFVVAAHKDLWKTYGREKAHTLTLEQYNEIHRKAANDYLVKYRYPLLRILERAMPHLESLSWYNDTCLDTKVWKTIARLPLRHLKLSGVYVGDRFV